MYTLTSLVPKVSLCMKYLIHPDVNAQGPPKAWGPRAAASLAWSLGWSC